MQPAASLLLSLSLLSTPALSILAAEPESTSGLEQFVQSAQTYESGQSTEAFRRLEEAVRQSIGKPTARKEIEAALLKLLEPACSFEAKKFACEQLAVVGSESSLPALSKLLSDPETTSIACLALTTYPSGKADAVLRDALKWPGDKSEIQIVNLLGDRRDPKAVDLLGGNAKATDHEIARAAIAALGKIGTPEAWKIISRLDAKSAPELAGPLADAKLRAAAAMKAAGDLKHAKQVYEELLEKSELTAVRRSALAVLLTLDRDQGEDRILEILSGTNSSLKAVAIAGIPAVTSPGSTEKFSDVVYHLKPEEQGLLLETLAKRDTDSTRVTLAKALSSQEPIARRAAVTALGRVGDPYFAGLIAQSASLATEPEETRAIENALVGLKGGADTDKRLTSELKASAAKPRITLIAAIARRQGSGANPVLLEEADNTDPAVAKAAYRALARTGTSTNVAQILTKLAAVHDAGVRTEAESTAAQVLARINNVAGRSVMVREAFSKATTPEAKVSLITLLPACADAEALAALKSAAADSEPQVREAAVRALSGWPDESARDVLLSMYRQPQSGTVHELALRGLVRMVAEENARPDPQVVEHYRQLIGGAKNAGELKLILGALSGYGHPEALPLALPLLSDPEVRTEAVVAVKKIAEAIKAQNPQLAEEALKRLPNQ